jgi:hypothetical protein
MKVSGRRNCGFNQCRMENEFFTRPERYLNDRMGRTFTFGRPEK